MCWADSLTVIKRNGFEEPQRDQKEFVFGESKLVPSSASLELHVVFFSIEAMI